MSASHIILSATKLDAFADPSVDGEGCQRLGAFQYWGDKWGHEREPKGAGAKLGIAFHELGEAYQKYGKKPDRLTIEGEMFLEGIPYLPYPETSEAEGEKELSIGGFDFTMKIDLLAVPPKAERQRPHLIDYKTSSNPAAYGLWQPRTTGEGWGKRKGFLDDTQAVIYLAWFSIFYGVPEADLMWLYFGYKKKKRKDPLTGEVLETMHPPFTAKPSYFTAQRCDIEEAFGRLVLPRAELVARLESDKPDPLSLDPNPDRCHKYGKNCFRASTCNLSGKENIFGIRKKERLEMSAAPVKSLAAILAERLQAAGGGSAPAEAPATPAPAKPKSVPPPAAAPAPVAAAPAPAPAKPDLINPPEAAKSMDVTAALREAAPALRAAAASTPIAAPLSANVAAIFAQRIGEALLKVAEDLRK